MTTSRVTGKTTSTVLSDDKLKGALAEFLLAVADDKLMLGHHNSDWTGLGPMLEEDIAFSSLAQDEIAHAQALYELAGSLLDRDADELAFGRSVDQYRCASIVELSDDFDWAVAITRQFFCDTFDQLRLNRLARSSYQPLAALAWRLAAEEAVHVAHVTTWVGHLGRGTDESKRRMQSALDRLAPHAVMLAEAVEGQDELESSGLYPPLSGDTSDNMFDCWWSRLREIVSATGSLQLPAARHDPQLRGGRRGAHTDDLTELLAEMCEVYRIEPGAAW